MNIAPRLLKYMPAPLFIENGLFRFTQPTALNDPYEAMPRLRVSSYSPEDVAVARKSARASGHGDLTDEMLIGLFLRPFPSRRFDEKSFPGLWPASEPRLRPEPFDTIAEFDQALAERAIALAMQHSDQTIGILSLSTQTNETMWAHYTNDHHGVCIGFDPAHPFFNRRVKAVTYSAEPVVMSVNGGMVRLAGHTLRKEDILNGRVQILPDELLWRKSVDWEHQQEWRMIMPLPAAAESIPTSDPALPICLFEIPYDAVLGLTFGWRASDASVTNALMLIESRPEWHHLTVRRRRRTALGMTEEALRR